ncbi:hypothetical protein PR048_016594 [Dryococelus australis]|uniref:YqaJ viral recombinase domain-containing protein n=1 Tax=Dryococelus australis TaxID=614101 RepID=A0ABQ9H7C4_9NEOP|nr:hypothetical protein PR048_016594 [Dryococelus australis]
MARQITCQSLEQQGYTHCYKNIISSITNHCRSLLKNFSSSFPSLQNLLVGNGTLTNSKVLRHLCLKTHTGLYTCSKKLSTLTKVLRSNAQNCMKCIDCKRGNFRNKTCNNTSKRKWILDGRKKKTIDGFKFQFQDSLGLHSTLGATADGLVDLDAIVEVKCSISAKNLTPKAAIFFQERTSEHRTEENYYRAWTPVRVQVKVEVIYRDDKVWYSLLPEFQGPTPLTFTANSGSIIYSGSTTDFEEKKTL